ncbi:conserved protein of unknown function [Candidatus Promineifilum breve]|uniref:Uncharacterized protein n=2 Tax=Candidatus Promineifilum breve TaxID=1806508 RepID=A0A160T9G7_9CHLR|nr:conserved protein of unknown function [Candidatus Promineifilum breve]
MKTRFLFPDTLFLDPFDVIADIHYHRGMEQTLVRAKLVHEGEYVAEVDVALIITDDEWSPYLSLLDAYKLDDVRQALRQGDIEAAAKLGRVYKLIPVAV